jgi:hypothetical protein
MDGSQRPTGWRRHGAADAARAHRSSALHGYGAPFFVVFLPTEPAGCGVLTRGAFNWRGTPVGCAAARLKLQPSATVGGSSKGRLTTRLGKMGAAQDVEHRR